MASAKFSENLRFIIGALVFARNAAPERAATEDIRDVTTNGSRSKQKLCKSIPRIST
jgi:hypothetical protein